VSLDRSGVVALSLRAGFIRPHGDPEDPDLDSFDLVPSAERFYAGGRTTHRAFSRDELGVPGETLFVEEGEDPVPLGGGALGLLNVEWRFPIAGGFGGSVFVDGGNVWREPGEFDADEVRWGAGVGLRYLSPVGPLRLEIGWKLDREPFEDPSEWFISLGNPF
jgi:outer membrane protein insertion porin family